MGQVQEAIKSLHNFQGEKNEYIEKAKEILRMLSNQPEIYTIQSPKNTRKDLLNRSGKIFCGINEVNEPCLWLFSEKQYACAYAEHFKFKANDFLLIRSIPTEDLRRILFKAMFKGVKTVRIDEGFTYLNSSIYDILNATFEAVGEEGIIKNTDKPIISFLLEAKLKNRNAYAITDSRKLGQQSFFDFAEEAEQVITSEENIIDDIVLENRKVTIYTRPEDVKVEVSKEESSNMDFVELNINDLNELFIKLNEEEAEVDVASFVAGENSVDINIKKVSMITSKIVEN